MLHGSGTVVPLVSCSGAVPYVLHGVAAVLHYPSVGGVATVLPVSCVPAWQRYCNTLSEQLHCSSATVCSTLCVAWQQCCGVDPLGMASPSRHLGTASQQHRNVERAGRSAPIGCMFIDGTAMRVSIFVT
jgi:hypothetical protein